MSRLSDIDQSNFSPEQIQLLTAIFSHLEEKRGWLADRLDAISEDEKLADCATQLVYVLLSAKSDCVVQARVFEDF